MIVIDNVLKNPQEYRAQALAKTFHSVSLGTATFHGIAPAGPVLPEMIERRFPRLASSTSFFRKSPQGQIEPNFVHTDEDMGTWTGIFYLNENPPEGDGTNFWRHRKTGAIKSTREWTGAEDWAKDAWELDTHVAAEFNRLVLFPARLFHSRAIYQNYGTGDDARLIQVVFGTGTLPEEVH